MVDGRGGAACDRQRPVDRPGHARGRRGLGAALKAALHDADVEAAFDARGKHVLRIGRRHHGNTKTSVISADFIHGADYEALSSASRTFKGLVGEGAGREEGRGERQKGSQSPDFRIAAMAWLMQQADPASAASATRAWAR